MGAVGANLRVRPVALPQGEGSVGVIFRVENLYCGRSDCMNNEEKILSLLEKMYIDFNKRFENNEKELAGVKQNMATKDELASVKATVIRIENDHSQKFGALLTGSSLIRKSWIVLKPKSQNT